jgi:hypothetical protein
VNRSEQFVDFRAPARDIRQMADARRVLKSKKSSLRGIGFPLAN